MEPVKNRIYAFDTLRTVMVLLGIVIHAALLYQSNIFGLPVFYNDPRNHSGILNVLADLIHIFRMPVFYVISGFFTAMLYLERGSKQMINNRLHRLVYPFIVGLIFLLPLFLYSMNFFAAGLTGAENRWSMAFSNTFKSFQWEDIYTVHLWFLYYLIWYCVAVLALGYTINRWFPAVKNGFVYYFRLAFRSKLAPLIFAILSAVGLYFMGSFDIKAADSFVIDPLFFVTFGLYFVFGWLCYCIKEELPRFEKLSFVYLGFALVLFAVRWKLMYAYHDATNETDMLNTLLIVLLAFCVWFFVFGIMGIFMKFFNRPSKIARFISDGSYWIYLIHMPIVVILQTLLLDYDVPALIKFLLVNLITFTITVLSYNYLVRNTLIGRFLNGKKAPRAF